MLVIVGLDPGTTVGLAVLNLRGGLISTESFRNKSSEEVIQKIYSTGRPLAIGSDKQKIPKYISDICSKTGAKPIAAKDDLSIKEKEQITSVYDTASSNSHERDALAGAFIAYKELRPTIEKLRAKTSEQGFESILYEAIVKEKSLSGILEKRAQLDKQEQGTKDFPQRKTNGKNPLSERIDELKEQNRLLKKSLLESQEESEKLKKKLKDTKSQIKSISERMLQEQARKLNAKTEMQQRTIDELNWCLKDLNSKHLKLIELVSSEKSIILPAFKSFGLEGKRIKEEITEGSMVFVDEPADSPEVLELLAKKSIKAFTLSKGAKKHFVLDRVLFKDKKIVITDKEAIKRAIESKTETDISQLLSEYKNSRKSKQE